MVSLGCFVMLLHQFAPRQQHVSLCVNSTVYVCAGVNTVTGAYYNDCWGSTNLGVTWWSAGQAPFAGRAGAAGYVLGSSLYVHGGVGASGAVWSDVWSSDASMEWWLVSAGAGPSRSAAGAVVAGGSFVLIGGDDGVSSAGSNLVWVSADRGVTWSVRCGAAPFSVRSGHSVILANGALFL